MLAKIQDNLQKAIRTALLKAYPQFQETPIEVEIPADTSHGDYSTNIALKSAKILRKSPKDIAQDFKETLQEEISQGDLSGVVQSIEVKNPGFINFFLFPQAYFDIVSQIIEQGQGYGRNVVSQKEKVQIEFVSANPTGPLSIAHARQAAVGDALANIMNFCGYEALREYYINDGGNQIKKLGESLKVRALESLGHPAELPEGGYEGQYVLDMAKEFMAKHNLDSVDAVEGCKSSQWEAFGVTYLLDVIKKDLEDFHVNFDIWTKESDVANSTTIQEVLDQLEGDGYLYEHEGALWFKSTQFGDDKDRVVRKSDNSFTYLTPDIVYHKNKYERGFDRVINIWGPDHHGYIPRINAAVQALGKDPEALNVLIVQLATIYRDGKAVSMSTRKGQFISLREVLDEVGVDAARYFFLMRQIKQHLDFDLEVAKKETPENPVYYIQYAHARIHSIYTKAQEAGIVTKNKDFSRFCEKEELELIKALGAFQQKLEICCKLLDPSTLVTYLHELAISFHRFYDKCKVISSEEKDLSAERLALASATQVVIANGLKLLGISTPEKM